MANYFYKSSLMSTMVLLCYWHMMVTKITVLLLLSWLLVLLGYVYWSLWMIYHLKAIICFG